MQFVAALKHPGGFFSFNDHMSFCIGKSIGKYIMEINYLEIQVTMELRGDFARIIS